MPRSAFFHALLLNALGLVIFSCGLIFSTNLRAEEEQVPEKTDQKKDDSDKKSSPVEKTQEDMMEEIKSGLGVGEYLACAL